MTTEEILQTEPGVPKEEFLSTLSPEDKENLTNLSEGFMKTMESFNRRGALIVVGGIMNKPHPRKDIDIVLIIEKKEGDLTKDPKETQLDFANKNWHNFKNLVSRMLLVTQDLKILSEIPPTIDEEFDNPNILKNDGSITLGGDQGLPIELIRDPKGNTQERIASQANRFSILAKI